MVEKKSKLLLHPGPPRSGTTYIYDLVERHHNQEFRETIQPPKGWKYIDHVHQEYLKGKIDTQSYMTSRMRFKENRLTQPNIIQILERCIDMPGITHTGTPSIFKGFSKSFPSTADVHMAMVPHLANISHLYPASKTYMRLHDKDGHLFTPQEVCDIGNECIRIATDTYVNILTGFANSQIYESIDFVINLRDPRNLYISNMQNQEYINSYTLDMWDMTTNFIPANERKNIEQLGEFGKYIMDHRDKFDPCAILYYALEHQENLAMDVYTARNINEFYLYNVSMMRIYEQFIGLAEHFKDHPTVNIKFLNENTLNNAEQISDILPYFKKDMVEQSPVYRKKTNSVIDGIFPENVVDELLKEEDKHHNKTITKFKHVKFANKLISRLQEQSEQCSNFEKSNVFVDQQNLLLDK